jgi:hypothetical protein
VDEEIEEREASRFGVEVKARGELYLYWRDGRVVCGEGDSRAASPALEGAN